MIPSTAHTPDLQTPRRPEPQLRRGLPELQQGVCVSSKSMKTARVLSVFVRAII